MKEINVYVAASDSTAEQKSSADFICDGSHDELIIQKAVYKCIEEKKNVFLFNGIYHIDGFHDFGDGGPMAAVVIPNEHREIRIVGQNNEYGFQKRFDNGVVLYVSSEAL